MALRGIHFTYPKYKEQHNNHAELILVTTATTAGGVFELVYFFGRFGPILTILSQIYAFFVVLFTGLNSVSMYQN